MNATGFYLWINQKNNQLIQALAIQEHFIYEQIRAEFHLNIDLDILLK